MEEQFEKWWDNNDDPDAPHISRKELARAAFMDGSESMDERRKQVVIGASKLAQAARRHAALECVEIVDNAVRVHRWGKDGSCGINTAIKSKIREIFGLEI